MKDTNFLCVISSLEQWPGKGEDILFLTVRLNYNEGILISKTQDANEIIAGIFDNMFCWKTFKILISNTIYFYHNILIQKGMT